MATAPVKACPGLTADDEGTTAVCGLTRAHLPHRGTNLRPYLDGLHAEPMRYHGPGWEVVPFDTGTHYMLWAPGAFRPCADRETRCWHVPACTDIPGRGLGRIREHWAASWARRGGAVGGFTRGGSPYEVLRGFPADPEGRRAVTLLHEAGVAHENRAAGP